MSKTPPLQIAFLDVGHGDTIIISTIENNVKRAIIIDCNDAIRTRKYILANEIQVVDYILITHLHQDHYSGVNMLINELIKKDIKINNICWEKDKYLRTDNNDNKNYRTFIEKLRENHIKNGIRYVSKRFDDRNYRRLDNGVIKNLKAEIIYPNSFIANNFDDNNVNNTSAVVQIQYNKFKIILPGDLEGEGWNMLKMYTVDDIQCDILKMPHHGGYFGESSDALSLNQVIDMSKPKFAIISSGQNEKYKHPSKDTIKCLSDNNINILCTEVTDLCDNLRLDKKECIKSLLGTCEKIKEKSCPCVGDIIFEIDDKIRIIPNDEKKLNQVRENFENRICKNIVMN